MDLSLKFKALKTGYEVIGIAYVQNIRTMDAMRLTVCEHTRKHTNIAFNIIIHISGIRARLKSQSLCMRVKLYYRISK